MKYVTIEISGTNEISNVRVNYETEEFNFGGEDMSRIGRELAHWLRKLGFPTNEDGKVEILAFGVPPMGLLCHVPSLFRYVEFVGGIHNPAIFYINREGMLPTVHNVNDMVKRFYNLRLK